ncbi:MAG: trehalase family glycosidase [Opitutus sp.]
MSSSENKSGSRPTLDALARSTLDGNWREGYTLPSPKLYPFQWNWDSGFIALGLAYYNPERAMAEIRSMFKGQWRSGMLPHINFHRPDPNYFPGPEVWETRGLPNGSADVATSGITQPPVFAFILERISALPFGRTPEWKAFVRELYPRILAQHRHLYTHRDPEGEGLVYIQHNWEAGTDNSPAYDAILDGIDVTGFRDVSALRRDLRNVDALHRPTNANYQRYIYLVDLFIECGYDDALIARRSPFLVQDVLFNSMLARSNRSLIALAQQIGADSAEVQAWNLKTEAAINTKLWDADAGFYFSFDLRNRKRIRLKTSSGFMPLFAGICSSDQRDRLADHLTRSFTTSANGKLCTSTAVDESAFDPVKYWRGPIWINVNWMLYHGLRRHGLTLLAERVKRETLELLETRGMWEYFDPRTTADGTGVGLGTDAFSWSAALALDLIWNPDAF